jgi:hypothetical protein
MNKQIIHNFEVLCVKYLSENRTDLFQIHKNALDQLKACKHPITPSNTCIHLTEFDGVNCRNKVLKILQSKQDLEEVYNFKNHKYYKELMTIFFLKNEM